MLVIDKVQEEVVQAIVWQEPNQKNTMLIDLEINFKGRRWLKTMIKNLDPIRQKLAL